MVHTMSSRPPSVVAERAVRYLHASGHPASSVRLARELLAMSVSDEAHARRVLDTAFGDDPRLAYEGGLWREIGVDAGSAREPDIAFAFVDGLRDAPGARFQLTTVAASRRRSDEIVAACGSDLASVSPGTELKVQLKALLEGARVVLFAPPAGLSALESWLDEPLSDPLPLSLLARRRCGKSSLRDLEQIAAALSLTVRIGDDPASRVELLVACFDALRKPGEPWAELIEACRTPHAELPWPRYAFSRDDLKDLPPVPGTYRFYDLDSKLLYVGKSRNLKRRLAAWFGDNATRGAKGQAIVEAVHRFEFKPSGSELEALLREATQIRRELPSRNVQRKVHARPGRPPRLRSILILEPAEPPWTLRAWLIRENRLLDSVPLGPKGGGLRRIERILRDEFFDPRQGPKSGREREIDVEIVARWLAGNKDKAVAFDPTHLPGVDDVVSRLRWFLSRGALHDPEGSPILPR
jgi:hypothetical protein